MCVLSAGCAICPTRAATAEKQARFFETASATTDLVQFAARFGEVARELRKIAAELADPYSLESSRSCPYSVIDALAAWITMKINLIAAETTFLRSQADRCRQLGKAARQPEIMASLAKMAHELRSRADKLESQGAVAAQRCGQS
jgi:hypothetical protein